MSCSTELATYLERYESQLSAVVADESFVQEERRRNNAYATRTTNAEILLLRLQGEPEWLGIRDVKKVNGKAVAGTGVTLTELLTRPDKDVVAKAAAIVEASARYNLGSRRTINMPTIPLEALSPRNHPRFIFKLRGGARVAGVQTERLEFNEFDEPTLVPSADGGPLWSRGLVWLEPDTGAVWRAELIIGPDKPGGRRRIDLEARIRVEFGKDPALGMMVPRELSESFWIRGGIGSGKGKYHELSQSRNGRAHHPRVGALDRLARCEITAARLNVGIATLQSNVDAMPSRTGGTCRCVGDHITLPELTKDLEKRCREISGSTRVDQSATGNVSGIGQKRRSLLASGPDGIHHNVCSPRRFDDRTWRRVTRRVNAIAEHDNERTACIDFADQNRGERRIDERGGAVRIEVLQCVDDDVDVRGERHALGNGVVEGHERRFVLRAQRL